MFLRIYCPDKSIKEILIVQLCTLHVNRLDRHLVTTLKFLFIIWMNELFHFTIYFLEMFKMCISSWCYTFIKLLFMNSLICFYKHASVFSLYIIPSSLLHAWDIAIIAMANTDQITEKRRRQLPQLVIGAIIYFFAFLTKKVKFLSKRTQTYIVWGILPRKTPYQLKINSKVTLRSQFENRFRQLFGSIK